LLRVLARRGVELTDAFRQRVLACSDVAQLDLWLDRAATAKTLNDVLAG
jgi:hypothetical protein